MFRNVEDWLIVRLPNRFLMCFFSRLHVRLKAFVIVITKSYLIRENVDGNTTARKWDISIKPIFFPTYLPTSFQMKSFFKREKPISTEQQQNGKKLWTTFENFFGGTFFAQVLVLPFGDSWQWTNEAKKNKKKTKANAQTQKTCFPFRPGDIFWRCSVLLLFNYSRASLCWNEKGKEHFIGG